MTGRRPPIRGRSDHHGRRPAVARHDDHPAARRRHDHRRSAIGRPAVGRAAVPAAAVARAMRVRRCGKDGKRQRPGDAQHRQADRRTGQRGHGAGKNAVEERGDQRAHAGLPSQVRRRPFVGVRRRHTAMNRRQPRTIPGRTVTERSNGPSPDGSQWLIRTGTVMCSSM